MRTFLIWRDQDPKPLAYGREIDADNVIVFFDRQLPRIVSTKNFERAGMVLGAAIGSRVEWSDQ